jgi:hypothetical protein
MEFAEIYYEELMENSYAELLELCQWLNNAYSFKPMVLGGWAVFFHKPSLGARNIEILVSDDNLRQIVINGYLIKHEYQSGGVFKKEYFKDIRTSKNEERILVNCRSADMENRVKGTDITIPWDLVYNYQKGIEVKKVVFYIPQAEMMLILKAKEALERSMELKRAYSNYQVRYEILKDYDDILTLVTNCEIDIDLLRNILGHIKFHNHFKLVFDRIKSKDELMQKYKYDWKATISEFMLELDL